MVDDRLLGVRLPEVVDAKAARRVTRITILYVPIDLATSTAPEGLVFIASTQSVGNAGLDNCVSQRAAAADPSIVVFCREPSNRPCRRLNIFKSCAFDHASGAWGQHDPVRICLLDPIDEFRPVLG